MPPSGRRSAVRYGKTLTLKAEGCGTRQLREKNVVSILHVMMPAQYYLGSYGQRHAA